ncbi:MAG TPA: SusC/RagA family TonB-linked outer membrane protein [Gemmatimonadaceae bacterium]|nr:SusC/RagA family TonB-linked outer membrane protein [Gemmatimonadaceae bacterium]
MTRTMVCALALAFTSTTAFAAQQTQGEVGTVVGQVLGDVSRLPIAGAQVSVVGTTLGAVAGAEGRYIIRNVPVGERILRVRLIGYAPLEDTITVTRDTTITADFALTDVPYSLSDVVITALGITRAEKSLGYGVQTITSQTLERVPETTLMQALAGQSAGVSVTSSSGRPGAGARVTIRGENSFSGNSQPLFVIDGMPVATNSDGPSNALGTGSSGSRQMDIDMENIENITVLRGAAATALYGSRAANGAIIITTKRGKTGLPLTFEYSSQVRYDSPIIKGYTTDWAAGSRGYFCNGRMLSQGGWCEPGATTAPETRLNWGPHKDSIPQMVFDSVGPVRFRDAREDFYKSSPSVENALRGRGSMGDLGTYTFGASWVDQRGVNPMAALDRLTLSGNVSFKWNDWLTSTTSLQRIRVDNPFLNDSFDGLDHDLIDTPPSTDTRQAWMPDGSPVMYGGNEPHYMWSALNEYNSEQTNRWILGQQFSLKLMPGLQLSNNAGVDAYVSEYGRFVNERPWRTAQNQTSGSTRQRKSTRRTFNNDLQLILDPRPLGQQGKVTVGALVGANMYLQDASFVEASGSSIVIPGYFNIGNFATQTTNANLPTKRRLIGAYSQVTADYADWAFLTLTGRNDWSSTLPTNANSYFYPSASLAVVFTDALKWRPSWLDFGKLRLSTAKVGNDAPPYSLSTRYVTGGIAKGANNDIQQFGGPSISFPFRGVTAYTQSTQLGNPDLRPESTIENELGLEMRFFGGRARGEISLYRKNSYDQIFSVPSSAVTGYTSIVRNAGDLQNNGIEISLHGRPLEIGSLSANVGVNWAKNKSKVLSLAPGVTSIYLAGYSWPQIRVMEGQPYGVIWGYGWKRNCVDPNPCFAGSPAGTLLIADNGYPIRTDELRNLGSVMPDWTGSVTTEVRWRNFGLSALTDVRHGGKLINFETQYTTASGRSIFTNDRYTYVVHDGINENTGAPNTVRLFKDQDYYPLMYGFDRHENQIEPAGFVKLREVTFSYRVPEKFLRRVNLDAMSVYLTGRNLKVWSDFSGGDPESDVYGGQNAGGQFFRQFGEPQTRSWLFGLRSTF